MNRLLKILLIVEFLDTDNDSDLRFKTLYYYFEDYLFILKTYYFEVHSRIEIIKNIKHSMYH